MKIIHLLSSNSFSGAENVICQIINMFKDEPDIEMLYCSPDGQIRNALQERDIKFVSLSDLNPKEVKRVIEEQKPDVIYAHDMGAGFVAACVCGRIPLISHIHNNAFDSRGVSLKSIAYLLAAKKAKHIFWVSKTAFSGYAFHNWFSKKSSVLYNVIDVNALKEKTSKDKNSYNYDVIFLGRLSYPKNPERLLKVFSILVEKFPKVKIAIAGTGELENEVKILSKEYALDKNIDFLGFCENPFKILQDSKVMVMTSRWEGTPMCALEAQALGVPIVSTPTDGLKDLIKHGETGFLSDDDEKLAEYLLSIIKDENLRENLSRNALGFSQEFNNVEKYKFMIDSVLKDVVGI